jgi:hypothetical protein
MFQQNHVSICARHDCVDRNKPNIDSGVKKSIYVYRGVYPLCIMFEERDYTVIHFISYCHLDNNLTQKVG